MWWEHCLHRALFNGTIGWHPPVRRPLDFRGQLIYGWGYNCWEVTLESFAFGAVLWVDRGQKLLRLRYEPIWGTRLWGPQVPTVWSKSRRTGHTWVKISVCLGCNGLSQGCGGSLWSTHCFSLWGVDERGRVREASRAGSNYICC